MNRVRDYNYQPERRLRELDRHPSPGKSLYDQFYPSRNLRPPPVVSFENSNVSNDASVKSVNTLPTPVIRILLSKLKTEMLSRGANGLIGMQRTFRIVDRNSDGFVTFDEFRKSIIDMNLKLSDDEIRILFRHLDSDRSGSINVSEFLSSIRIPLSIPRLRIVNQAFDSLDQDGVGLVNARGLLETFDPTGHPEVRTGRISPEHCLTHFLETFDVGREVEGQVTREEFIDYYTNIGANIDNDEYFERMVRGVWHLSPPPTGSIRSSSPTNKPISSFSSSNGTGVRFVSTPPYSMSRVRGSEIASGNQMAAALGRASSVTSNPPSSSSFTRPSSSSSSRSTTSPTPPPPPPSHGLNSPRTTPISSLPRHSQLKIQQDLQTVVELGAPPTAFSKEQQNHKKIFQQQNQSQSPKTIDYGTQNIVKKIQHHIHTRGGGHGYINLQRKFRLLDSDGDRAINLRELKKGFQEMDIKFISESEIRLLFEQFDSNQNGIIDLEEFLSVLRKPLNATRLQLVEMAFAILDTDGSGVVDAEELVGKFDPSSHPEVLSGKCSPEKILENFLKTFDVGGEVDGHVTRDEFINYYTNLGASIDEDDYFELMIRNAWHISGGEGWSANSANRRVLVTGRDGRESVVEIKQDLGLAAKDKAGMMSRLKAQGVDVESQFHSSSHPTCIEMSAPNQSKQSNPSPSSQSNLPRGVNPIYQSLDPYHRNPSQPISVSPLLRSNDFIAGKSSAIGVEVGPSGRPTMNKDQPRSQTPNRPMNHSQMKYNQVFKSNLPFDDIPLAPRRVSSSTSSSSSSSSRPQSRGRNNPLTRNTQPSYGVQLIIHKLKQQIQTLGKGLGYITLQRKFKLMTDSGQNYLRLGDFKKALKEMSVDLNENEFRMVFEFFDQDSSGGIDFNEFLQGVRDPLSESRLRLVEIAFSILDKDGSGVVDVDELINSYDTSKHPEVLAGRMTPQQALTHFLETFDVGGEVDGHVTRDEFINYYTNLGASIDNDDYFELMIRNAWHISGGEAGWSSMPPNSSEREGLSSTSTALRPGSSQGYSSSSEPHPTSSSSSSSSSSPTFLSRPLSASGPRYPRSQFQR